MFAFDLDGIRYSARMVASFTGGKCSLRRVPLNGGGYDRRGRYYGVGSPLWEVEAADGEAVRLRALSRSEAIAKCEAAVAGIRFARR